MQRLAWETLCLALALSACQSSTPTTATLVVDGRIVHVLSSSRQPSALLKRAGAALGSGDLVLNNGVEIAPDQAIPLGDPIRLQVVRSIPVLINGSPFLTASRTVAQAVRDLGLQLHPVDSVDPPADSPLSPGMLITVRKSVGILADADSSAESILAAEATLGASLADAGIPMEGLDTVVPSETDVPMEQGEARLARISESVLLESETIPFESNASDSPELELGVEQILQPGMPGLAVSKTRVRYQDGAETSRREEPQVVVVEPQDRVVVRGTKLVDRTETVDGVSITYWHSMQMFATVYSPCNSGTGDGTCSSGTASGRPAGKGVVAVDPALYAYLNGQRLYIPGYGFAVIGDVGGGYIIEQNLGVSRFKWIDLGFDDNNVQDMTGWVSVYFLAPAPAAIPDVLK